MVNDDASVLRASLEDDPDAFGAIFDRHHERIWAYLARMAGRERADELAGDVFVTAFARRTTYDEVRGPVVAWLYGIAANMLRTRLRTEARAARAFARAGAERHAAEVPTDAFDDAASLRQRMVAVRTALVELSTADRDVIVLYAWERLSYQEIAVVLGVEVGTVKSRLSRARTRLRELLAASGQVLDDVTAIDGGP